jgi:hypothetical protein
MAHLNRSGLIGQFKASWTADKKAHAGDIFQFCNLLADRTGGDAQFFGRFFILKCTAADSKHISACKGEVS